MEIIIYDLTVGPYERIIPNPYLFHSVNRGAGYTDIFPDMYSSSVPCHQYRRPLAGEMAGCLEPENGTASEALWL